MSPSLTGAEAVVELERLESKLVKLTDQAEALAAQPDLPFAGEDKP